jgi:hypothetical protein
MIYGTGMVCAAPICGPCNNRFGNENIFRCYSHSENEKENATQVVITSSSKRGSDTSQKQNRSSEYSSKETSSSKRGSDTSQKQNRSSEYSSKELLILSQAYIKTSENSIEGTSQKKTKFWDDVAENYRLLKRHQEEYDERQKKRKKYNDKSLRRSGSFLSEDSDSDEDGVVVVLPPRTASSLQQKWSKSIQPYVTKFIGLTERYPKLSGEGNHFPVFISFLFSLVFPNFFVLFLRFRTILQSYPPDLSGTGT